MSNADHFKALAIVRLAEANEAWSKAAEAWNKSGVEIQRLTNALAAEEAKNRRLRNEYHEAHSRVEEAKTALARANRAAYANGVIV